jgi:hypothetical protein
MCDYGLQTVNIMYDMYMGNGVRKFGEDLFDCIEKRPDYALRKEDRLEISLQEKLRNDKLQVVNDSLNKELLRVRTELTEANARVKILKDASSDENEVVRLEGIISQYEGEKEAYICRIAKLIETLKSSETQKLKIQDDLLKKDEELEFMVGLLEERKEDLDEEKQKMSDYEKKVDDLLAEVTQLRGEIASHVEATNEIQQVSQESENLEAEREKLKNISFECERLRTENVKIKNENRVKMRASNSSSEDNVETEVPGKDSSNRKLYEDMADTLHVLTSALQSLSAKQEQQQQVLQLVQQQKNNHTHNTTRKAPLSPKSTLAQQSHPNQSLPQQQQQQMQQPQPQNRHNQPPKQQQDNHVQPQQQQHQHHQHQQHQPHQQPTLPQPTQCIKPPQQQNIHS